MIYARKHNTATSWGWICKRESKLRYYKKNIVIGLIALIALTVLEIIALTLNSFNHNMTTPFSFVNIATFFFLLVFFLALVIFLYGIFKFFRKDKNLTQSSVKPVEEKANHGVTKKIFIIVAIPIILFILSYFFPPLWFIAVGVSLIVTFLFLVDGAANFRNGGDGLMGFAVLFFIAALVVGFGTCGFLFKA